MVPFATVGFEGVTLIDVRVSPATVRVVEPDIVPSTALIVVDPAPIEVARPFEPAALLIAATAVRADCQVTLEVRF